MRSNTRPYTLDEGPLQFAPQNELGVVFLFAHLAARWRIKVVEIRPAVPDCIAYQKTDHGEKLIKIEFEFKSKNFKAHGHSAQGCDWLVCWEHNWPGIPPSIKVIELRRVFGLGFNVWLMPTSSEFAGALDSSSVYQTWSVPQRAHKGDLVLFYLKRPEACIRHIYHAIRDPETVKHPEWRKRPDVMARIKRLCRLDSPVFLEDLRRHRVIQTASFMRANLQGRHNAMEYWPYIYDLIVRRNPKLKGTLAEYAPDQL